MADPLNTTLGTCTICTNQRPPGWGLVVLGAVVIAIGGAEALYVGWAIGPDPRSAFGWGLAAAVGAPLLLYGLYRMLTFEGGFATAALSLQRSQLEPGQQVEATVGIRPLHALSVRMATLELVAVEVIDAADEPEERILRTTDVALSTPPRMREAFAKPVSLRIPADWPLSMETPKGVTPARHIRSRVRVAVDFDAHPLLTAEQPVTIKAK